MRSYAKLGIVWSPRRDASSRYNLKINNNRTEDNGITALATAARYALHSDSECSMYNRFAVQLQRKWIHRAGLRRERDVRKLATFLANASPVPRLYITIYGRIYGIRTLCNLLREGCTRAYCEIRTGYFPVTGDTGPIRVVCNQCQQCAIAMHRYTKSHGCVGTRWRHVSNVGQPSGTTRVGTVLDGKLNFVYHGRREYPREGIIEPLCVTLWTRTLVSTTGDRLHLPNAQNRKECRFRIKKLVIISSNIYN